MFIPDRTRPVIERLADIDSFGTNHIEELSSVTYVGKEDRDGRWIIQKMDTSTANTTIITYASSQNNSSSDYSTAWTNRASLTYGLFNEIV